LKEKKKGSREERGGKRVDVGSKPAEAPDERIRKKRKPGIRQAAGKNPGSERRTGLHGKRWDFGATAAASAESRPAMKARR